jgi:hypothetical protein
MCSHIVQRGDMPESVVEINEALAASFSEIDKRFLDMARSLGQAEGRHVTVCISHLQLFYTPCALAVILWCI